MTAWRELCAHVCHITYKTDKDALARNNFKHLCSFMRLLKVRHFAVDCFLIWLKYIQVRLVQIPNDSKDEENCDIFNLYYSVK